MRRLESRSGTSEDKIASAPLLDFLQPSGQQAALGRFGPYEVIAHIASGGMGIVLKARDPALNRIVALKILPPTLAANALARARFVREARAAAAVVHEHVVPIYAVDECAGLPYIVMQFVQGRPLSERIRAAGPLRLEEILRIGAQTAAGLAAAHAQGLIHRDIKPGNILLENSVERVKLTDFGLARAADDAGLTRTGELAGTPEFMSPEQAGNEAVDHCSDLFSFGSVLYAMCTGHSPFQATSVIAAVRKVCDARPPPVHEVNPAIPLWFSDIVARLMAKVPDDRFQSAREVSELLERYLARVQRGELGELRGGSTRRAATARMQQRVAAGATAGLAIVAALIFPLTNRRAATSSPPPSPPVASIKNSSSSSSTAAFVLQDGSGVFVRALPDIEQAIQAAPPGAVIECRFTGDWPIEPLDLGDKPLTIRAVANTKPTFVITRRPGPLLRTRAPLVLEGLTFKIPAMESQPSLSLYQSIFNEPVIESSNAPLFMANCRVELIAPLGGPLGGGCCVGLLDNSFAAFQNCEFYAPINGGIGHLHTASWQPAASGPDRIIVRNCIQTGFAFVHPKGPRTAEILVELTRNSAAVSACAIGFTEPPEKAPFTVMATQNVFDVDYVVGSQPPARSESAEKLLRWIDATNVIKVKEGFTRTRPALTTEEQWRTFVGGWKGGVPVELGLSQRIMKLRTDMNQFTPARFLLSEAEAEQLERVAPGLSRTLGVQPEICGPGEPYDRWKRSAAYADWQRQIHEAFVGQPSRGASLKPSPPSPVQEPFVVKTEAGTSVGGFARIEDALAAAPAGAVIELCWNGSRDIDPVRLPAKPLTLRAGRGFRPVWSAFDSTSALSASAALTLEGIRLEMSSRGGAGSFPNVAPNRPRTPPSGLALLSITNGPLRIAHCTVEVKGGAMHQAGIVLANVGSGRVENTVLYTPAGKAIVWQQYSGEKGGAAELTVTNCVTHAAETLWLDLRESPRARLEIARCTFHGVATVCISPSLTTTNVEVNARQNIFHTASVILDARNSASPSLSQWLRWRGQENLYKPQQRYIAGTATPNGPERLEDWNRWWNQTGANSRVVQLSFANGASDLNRRRGSFPPDPDGFRITDLILVEGPPLERDQWSRFGADTASVGPR